MQGISRNNKGSLLEIEFDTPASLKIASSLVEQAQHTEDDPNRPPNNNGNGKVWLAVARTRAEQLPRRILMQAADFLTELEQS